MPKLRASALATLGCCLTWLNIPVQAQSHMDMLAEAAAPASAPDTAQLVLVASAPDSARPHWLGRFDAGYRTPPVHPYFRDEYRVIQDMRRLLLFVTPNVLPEFASLPEMFAIARTLPEAKQAQIIGTAIMGSMANQASEMVSRYLRRSHAGFLQWQLEKVTLRTRLHGCEARLYGGVNVLGFSLSAPQRGLTYSYQTTSAYQHSGVSYWVSRGAGWHYGWLNGAPIYGPRLASPFGQVSVSYESGNRVLLSGFELRRQMNVIVRVIYLNYLALPGADFLRSEVMLRW